MLMVNGEPVSVAIIKQDGGESCELCNLATAGTHRGKGYASQLVRHVMKIYQPRARRMIVGTSHSMVPYYERFGFKYSFTREGFFLNSNYAGVDFDEPGLKDMEVLSVEL